MTNFLVFRLYGAMASWGLPAVGSDRQTAVQPSRSAILGLLSAALGIQRDDEKALHELQQAVLIAVKQWVPGRLIRDYHTTQVPSSVKNVVHRTRKSELSAKKINTVLSSRDYRCDGLWSVAVYAATASDMNLELMKEALLKPAFHLYLGRKSCPLSLPLSPIVVKCKTIRDALDTRFPSITGDNRDDLWLGSDAQVTYFWQGDQVCSGLEPVQTTYPWDEPKSRSRWQFVQREQHQATVTVSPEQGVN